MGTLESQRWPEKEQPGFNGWEQADALPLECSETRSSCPDIRWLLPWENTPVSLLASAIQTTRAVVLDCSNGKAGLWVLLFKSGPFCFWSSLGLEPVVPIWMGLAWVAKGQSKWAVWSQPLNIIMRVITSHTESENWDKLIHPRKDFCPIEIT